MLVSLVTSLSLEVEWEAGKLGSGTRAGMETQRVITTNKPTRNSTVKDPASFSDMCLSFPMKAEATTSTKLRKSQKILILANGVGTGH